MRRVITKAEVVRHPRRARRIVLHLPLTFPWLPTWRHLSRAVGATP
jgi:hypothetical protein